MCAKIACWKKRELGPAGQQPCRVIGWVGAVLLASVALPARADGLLSEGGSEEAASGPETPAYDVLNGGRFDGGTALGWEVGNFGGQADAAVDDAGRLCALVQSEGNGPGQIQIRQNDLTLVAGRVYHYAFDAWASVPVSFELGATDEVNGVQHFAESAVVSAPLDGSPTRLSGSFEAVADSSLVKWRFLLGGGGVPQGQTLCLDNVRLLDPLAEPKVELPPPPPLHVNQVGYLAGRTKRASYAAPLSGSDPAEPRHWQLLVGDLEPVVVAQGMTQPFGTDAASGDAVHWLDFSAITAPSEHYRLRVLEGDSTVESFPFAIGEGLYGELHRDALAYFYHNRSGTPIEADVVGEPWSRGAGHLGDAALPLASCSGQTDCTLRDVAGGWYDAGDHGKYVVNGGISIWTLLNQYERAKYLGGNLGRIADGALRLPQAERENGVPDLLDEARWELDWFFKMQVPEGEPSAGMVYHKLHDESWSPLPTRPDAAPRPRSIHPPSTAATLNFAAVTAQCARIWENIDKGFSDVCLDKSRVAFDAALAEPERYAVAGANGGGGYLNGDVSDEFYWAASELFVTTGEAAYSEFMQAHPLHLQPLFPGEGSANSSLFSWSRTHGLGLVSLAVAGPWYARDAAWVDAARGALVELADVYRELAENTGYPAPLSAAAYNWGSNSAVANNLVVLALAADFTCDASYADAVHEGAGYLLGRNPLGLSYVTGYGSEPVRVPHHRFWAQKLDPTLPPAPPGALSGGPNSGLQDPLARWLEGCPSQRCFLDDINAWSLNEITINWNSPLAWVGSYLAEQGAAAERDYAAARCEARNRGLWPLGQGEWAVVGGAATLDSTAAEGGQLEVFGRGRVRLRSEALNLNDLELVGDHLQLSVVPGTWRKPLAATPKVGALLEVQLGRGRVERLSLGAGRADAAGQIRWELSTQALAWLTARRGTARLLLEARLPRRGGSVVLRGLRWTGEVISREAAGARLVAASEESPYAECRSPYRPGKGRGSHHRRRRGHSSLHR